MIILIAPFILIFFLIRFRAIWKGQMPYQYCANDDALLLIDKSV